jgi:hypothetical protein
LIDRDLAYEGFACPQTGLDNRPLLETLVVDHGRQLVEEFLCRHGARLEQRQSGLTAARAA